MILYETKHIPNHNKMPGTIRQDYPGPVYFKKHFSSYRLIIIQTRKFEISTIQFCIGILVLFGFIFVQLFQPYGLYRMVLSICY